MALQISLHFHCTNFLFTRSSHARQLSNIYSTNLLLSCLYNASRVDVLFYGSAKSCDLNLVNFEMNKHTPCTHKITRVDKACTIHGEWSVFNSRNKHTIEFYSSFLWRYFFNIEKTGSNKRALSVSFCLLFAAILQLFYIVLFFLLSTAIKCSGENHNGAFADLYVFIYWWHSMIETIFTEETTHFEKDPKNECSN